MARNISESSDTFYYDVACRTDEILFERLVGKMPSRKELDQMYTLSDGFKERMQKLIAAFDRRRTVPKAIRRIIVIAAIIAALVFGALNAGRYMNGSIICLWFIWVIIML